MREILGGLLGLVVIALLIYGGYYVTKNVSYKLFYKDLVLETIHETVKPEYLR